MAASEFETECTAMLRELREKRDKIRKRLGQSKVQLTEVNADIVAVKVSLRAYRRHHGLTAEEEEVGGEDGSRRPGE